MGKTVRNSKDEPLKKKLAQKETSKKWSRLNKDTDEDFFSTKKNCDWC